MAGNLWFILHEGSSVMPKPTDIRITSVKTDSELISYRAPIKFGGRVVTDAVLVNVMMEVETVDGRRGGGFGSMPMGNVWAWPNSAVSAEQALAAMPAFTEDFAGQDLRDTQNM